MDSSLTDLTAEIRRRVTSLGYELVDLRKRGTRTRVVLQIRVDRPDAAPGQGITVEECAAVNRGLQEWLDGTGVLGSRYVLEVSSPGIERPVRWREHWERFVGREVTVRVPERGRLRAKIVRVPPGSDDVVLRPADSDEEITVPLGEARDAKLVVDWSAFDWSATPEKKE